MIRFLLAAMAAFVLPSAVLADPIEYFQVEGVAYDDAIPAPEDILGFGVGDRPIRHDQMVAYLTQIAGLSDRISMETIGYTHEHRPILFFVVTAPENQSRIEDIRQAHLASLAPGAAPSGGPAVIWLNYGVHGAESAGMDAAIPTLYHFAAAQGDAIEETLDDAVILITAIFNPDGHSRRVNHVEAFGADIPVTDPNNEQHNLWTEARTNHYWFDLNRQWLLQTQPESQAWLEQWHRWKPQVSADFHEMGTEATFYFHPGEPLRRNPLIPERARELTQGIAQYHVRFLDSEARLYTSEEGFDNFYVGKGSTYPQVNGSLGILFEIGAARGGLIESERGLVRHGENVRTHFRTSLTTVEGALAQRDAIMAYQREFFASAMQRAARDSDRAYVFSADGDPERLNLFVDLLARHDVTVNTLARDVRVNGHTYRAGEAAIVQLAQPQYTMIRSIFDRVTEFDENIFYDVSGWTLPLAYDLEYAALGRAWSSDLAGAVLRPRETGANAPARSTYGYVLRWSDYYAPRSLYRLLDHDVRVRVATENVTIPVLGGPRQFAPGAVFVPLVGQDVSHDEIYALVREAAETDGVAAFSVTSGSTPGNSPDLGDRAGFRSVDQPSVLVLFDAGIASYDAGEVWHLLDHRMNIPVTLRRKDQLGGLDWSRYTHLIIVGGGNTRLSERDATRVQQWIREDGGVVIASRQGALMAQEVFLGVEADDDDDASGDEESGERPDRRNYSDLPVDDAEHIIGGAIFAGDLDPSHPIGFGYADRFIALHRNMTETLEWPEDDPFAVPVQYNEDPLLSGYASTRRQEEIAGTPAVVAQRRGRGAVVLFADNPNFRATFRGAEKMFLNAIFFSRLISPPSGDY
ncbi:M14 family zinc carboxypeptidase [Hyphobacterium sp. HN65]|uniref:M14 family zinc carboxypeptidase n=1 Tax=Hyphobacterium lacteum TaxID=3116575 RepID=A0ABU7LP31_9PROT|nr:M14 family zinc carboxypeptidase [Hyphobacterium sp. HN65]MEE2525680.1 M14 family zinc carboxypeptidase [Hyphobacterium sp. HN65]